MTCCQTLFTAERRLQRLVARDLDPAAWIHGVPSAHNHTGDPRGRGGGGIDVWSVSNVDGLMPLDSQTFERHLQPARTWLELTHLRILCAHDHVEKTQQVHRSELCRCRIIRKHRQPPPPRG